MHRFPSSWWLRTLAVAAIVLASARVAPAQKLPSDLEPIPRQATAFVHIRAADLYQSEPLADLRNLVEKAGGEALQTFARKSPIDPSTIERLTILCLTPKNMGEPFPSVDPEATSAIVIVRTTKPYDRLRVLEAMGIREKLYRRSLYHFNEELWSGLVLLDERTFLIGAEDSIVAYFDLMKASEPNGPLQAALETAAAGKHHIVIGLNPEAVGKTANVPPSLQAIFAARCGTATMQFGKDFRSEVKLDYTKADGAQEGEKAVRAALELGRQALNLPIGEVERMLNKDADKVNAAAMPENFMYVLALGYLRELDNLLAKTVVQREGNSVRMPFVYNRPEAANLYVMSFAAIGFLGKSVSTTFRTVGQALEGPGQESPQQKHLKALQQALEKYHADKGSYPPPALYDADGRPTLSWRVALLPYLGDEAKTLHAQFRLDEPWDSLHNKRLIKKMPPQFQPTSYGYSPYQKQWQTHDLLFVGPGAAFDAKISRKKADLRPDSILLLHVEDNTGPYWSKPVDLSYAADKPLPKLYEDSPFGGNRGLTALLANGTIKAIEPNTPEKEMRQLIEGKK